MMWRSKKKAAEEEQGSDKAAEAEKPTTTTVTEEESVTISNKEEEQVKPNFMQSLFKRKSVREEQKDEEAVDEKDAFETREQSETGAAEEDTTATTEADHKATEAKPSFMQSLFKRKSFKQEQKDEEEEKANEKDTSEQQEEDTTEDGEEVDSSARKSSMWANFFHKKHSTASAEDEAVEVEMKPDSSLQIHDKKTSQKLFRSPSSYMDPNRPSVHEEALEMLTGSLLIYIFADLREMARDGVIEAPEILKDPISVMQVMEAIRDHKEALEERAIDHDNLQDRLNTLKDMHSKAAQAASQAEEATGEKTLIGRILQGGPEAAISALKAQEALPDSKESVLAQYHDETATQGVVYGIAVNHLRKRVTVIFRGSVTQQDFLTDARSAQKKVPNPVHDLVEEAHHRIGIHTGFYTYLFAKDDEDEEKSRCQRILEDAKKYLKENPGYRLYLTGHSLGGALSTLCGFYAAIDDELIENGPVVVISIASPQVGHFKFCESFHCLERLGRLQHLRVANKEDMITHLPFLHIKAHVLSPVAVAMYGAGNLYRHCGIHLELKSVEEENKKKTQHFVCHPKSRGEEKETPTYSDEFHRAMDAAKLLYEAVVPLGKGDFDALTGFHSCTEYEERLMASQEYLSSVTLDQLYQDEGIVGKALAKSLSEMPLSVTGDETD